MKEEDARSRSQRSPSQVEADEKVLRLRGVRGRFRLLLLLALLLCGAALSFLLGVRLLLLSRHPPHRPPPPLIAPALDAATAATPSRSHAPAATNAIATQKPQAPAAAAAIATPSTDGVGVISSYTTDLSNELAPESEVQLCSVDGRSIEVCVVICKGITTAPPGVMASHYLSKEGASLCGNRSIHVIFTFCQFPGRKLEKGWFPVRNATLQTLIETLSIENAFIDYIGDDAFAGLRGLTRLEINGGEVQELRTAIFRSPSLHIIDRDSAQPFLKELYLIHQERLRTVENGLLGGMAALDSFQMIRTPNIETLLPNITAVEKSNVEILDLRYNVFLNTLRPSYFINMTKIQSLYFTNSQISVIEPGTFQNMKLLRLLYLDFTQLKTLSEDIIPDWIFKFQSTVYLGNNSWDCTCEIAWLGRKMNTSRNHFGGYLPECYTPLPLRRKLVNQVDFSHCELTSSATDSTTQETPSETITTQETTSENSPTDPFTTSSSDASHEETDATTSENSPTTTLPFTTSSSDSSHTEIPDTTTSENLASDPFTTSSSSDSSHTEATDTSTTTTSLLTSSTTMKQTNTPISLSSTTIKELTTTIKTTINFENNSSPLASTSHVSPTETPTATAIPPTTTPPFLLPQNVSDCKESKYKIVIFGTKHKHDKRGIGFPQPIHIPEGNHSNYPPTNPDFLVFETDGQLLVEVGNGTEVSDKKWSLVWIDEDNRCYIHVQAQSQLLIHGLVAGATYTVCLLFGETFAASPFNCRAVTMSLPYENRAWIVNAEKPYFIGLFSGIAIVIALLFMAVMYALVSRFPELLKRNKRVVIVNYQNTKALILPGGYKPKSSPKGDRKKNRKLLSPDSTASNTTVTTRTTTPRSSTTTYVSVNEPSEEELVIWRLHKMIDTHAAKEERKKKKQEEQGKGSTEGREEPPNPPDRIASISWRLEPPDGAQGSSA